LHIAYLEMLVIEKPVGWLNIYFYS
jgi:hypothetical protein